MLIGLVVEQFQIMVLEHILQLLVLIVIVKQQVLEIAQYLLLRMEHLQVFD
jgi:hypothetical protein